METTLIILKPDAVQRGLIGRVLSRFEDKGLQIVGAKFMMVPEELAQRHYAEHAERPFYAGLIQFVTSSPVLVLALRGHEAIGVCRKLIGSTNGLQAEAGTVRGDWSMSPSYNLVHGSDSPESAERELAMWFEKGELLDYRRTIDVWAYA